MNAAHQTAGLWLGPKPTGHGRASLVGKGVVRGDDCFYADLETVSQWVD
jgi:hypothetical protein